MNEKNSQTKEELLADIEKLLRYEESDKETIDPKLLAYLDLEALISIKTSLLEKVGTLSDEDRDWLQQFKKYEWLQVQSNNMKRNVVYNYTKDCNANCIES